MKKLSHVLLRLSAIVLFAVSGLRAEPLLFDNLASTIRVDPGATLSITNPVPNFNGTLIIPTGASVTGQLITFVDGVLENAGNELLLRAIFNPAGTISLTGNANHIRGEPGRILQNVTVSGGNNILAGQPRLTSPLNLTDLNTTLTVVLQSQMNQNINLNGGSLFLSNDLIFTNSTRFVGPGTVYGNSYRVALGGAPLTLAEAILWGPNSNLSLFACKTTLTSAYTFQGQSTINGEGNVLDLDVLGQIVLSNNCTLELQDVTLKKVKQNSFVFGTNSTLILCDVDLEFVSSVTFNNANIVANSSGQWFIKNNNVTFAPTSTVTVDGVTVWLDNAGAPTLGNVTATNLSLVNSGTIKPYDDDRSLQSCCDALRTSTGFLQSEIDSLINMQAMLKTSTGFLQSEIDSALNCCTALRTSTGFLQSEIDFLISTDNMLKTSTGFLQSEIDSVINCCTALRTSTGFLQSEIDSVVKSLACCNIQALNQVTFSGNDVLTTDWAFDDSLVAVGLNNNLLGSTNVLRIQSFNGTTLTQTAQLGFGTYAPVADVRWHPSQRILAVARRTDLTGGLLYSGSFSTYVVNAAGTTLTLGSTVEVGNDVKAIAWSPDGLFVAITRFNPILVAGTDDLRVYSVNQVTGALTLAASINIATSVLSILNASNPQALDWSASGNFIAVGLTPILAVLGGNSLAVYKFTSPGTLAFDSSVNVPALQGVGLLSAPVTAVNWNPSSTNILAVGVSIVSPILAQPVQIWTHGTGSLTYTSGVTPATLSVTINDLDFTPNGNCLAAGTTNVLSAPLVTYTFNQTTNILSVSTIYGANLIGAVGSTRWAHSANFLLDGSSILGTLIPGADQVFNAVCNGGSSCDCNAINSRLDELQSCCDGLRTSTGFLQSELDSCCAALKTSTGFLQSQIDVANSCCTALRTSTGFLQSEIDSVNSMVTMLKTSTGFLQSEIDAANNCCTALRTSTGFLQSEIDSVNSMVTMLKTSTGFLQSEIDAANDCCTALRTSTGFLQSEIDSVNSMVTMLKTSTGFLQSEIDIANNCCTALKTSTGFLQSQIDLANSCCDALKTNTGFLQSEIDSVNSMVTMLKTSTGFLQSEIDTANSCCTALRTSTGFLQSEIDSVNIMVAMLKTSTGFLQSEIDSLDSDLFTTISRVDILDSCCDALKTSTGFLQSEIDSANNCCTALRTSTGFLQSEIDFILSMTDMSQAISVLSRIDVLETCCAMLRTSTGFLQSEIDSLDSDLFTTISRVDILDSCCDALKTSTGFLQSEIDVANNCCTALRTSTGFLQSEIDSVNTMVTMLKTSTGFLQSEIDAANSCCDALRTSTGFLQSQIDLANSCCDALKTSTGFLQSEIDAANSCCDALRTSTGFLQSEIDSLDSDIFTTVSRVDILESCCDALKTSTGFLQSEIDAANSCCDALKTSTGFLQSQIDGISSSTGFIQSQVDSICSLTCISLNLTLVSIVDELQSCCDALRTSTGFLQSEIDACCNNLESRVELLETCCDALKTSTGFLQSQIDEVRSTTVVIDLTSIISRLDVLDTCCDALRTSTGFLQSEIDAANDCCDALKTSTGFLQSQIDLIRSTTVTIDLTSIISRLDVLDTCCDELRTSTGFLQSQIDSMVCEVFDCCNVGLFSAVELTNEAETADWSFDNRFIAVGLNNVIDQNSGCIDPKVLKIYELVGNAMVLRAETAIGNQVGEVSVVRWHPTKFRLAVGRQDIDDSDETRLHIYDFNPITFALVEKDSAEAVDVYAVSWRPISTEQSSDSSSDVVDILAVGRDVSNGELVLYEVHASGILTGPLPAKGIDTEGQVSNKALDWDVTGNYLAVGVEICGNNKSLQVYEFDDATVSLSLNAAADVETTPCDISTKSTVLTVDWSQGCPTLLAVGLKGKVGQLAQVFNHDGQAGSLTYKAGIDDIGKSVRSVDWKDCSCLAIGKSGSLTSGNEFRVYQFNKDCFTFDLSVEFNNFNHKDVEEVRWSPNGQYVLNGSDANRVSVYNLIPRKVTVCDLLTCISGLHSCCEANMSMINMLKTSTGFLQSQLDECCSRTVECDFSPLESQLEDLENCFCQLKDCVCQLASCCDRPERNVCMTDCDCFLSRIENLESCCDDLECRINPLESCCDDLESRVEPLEDCCKELSSVTDVLASCCDELRTSTGEIQSIADDCCKTLKSTTGFLQSQIDVLDSKVEDVASCCSDLQTAIEPFISCCDSLNSRVEEVESCCDALKTSTSQLQSQIDDLRTFSCFECPSSVISEIEELESCCSELRSIVDGLICPDGEGSCVVRELTDVQENNDVQTADWSCDGKYIAIGLDNSIDLNGQDSLDPRVLKVYQLVNNKLVLKAETTIGNEVGEVTCVRWHPCKYRIAVGQSDIDDSDQHRLHIFDFDPALGKLTITDSAEAVDVYAVAWRPVSLDDCASSDCSSSSSSSSDSSSSSSSSSDSSDSDCDNNSCRANQCSPQSSDHKPGCCSDSDGEFVLAVGRGTCNAKYELALYTVSDSGELSGPFPSFGIDTDGEVSNKALSWNADGEYLAVGVELSTDNKALLVYEFDCNTLELIFNASTDVESIPGNISSKSTVLAVDWNPGCKNLIAVGLKSCFKDRSEKLMQVFEHNGVKHSLTFKSGIPALIKSVLSVNWKDCTCLALGKAGNVSSGNEFRVYHFDRHTFGFDLTSEFNNFHHKDVSEVRWSPNGCHILNGSDDNHLNVYRAADCKKFNICDIGSIIEVLESCCDSNSSMICMLKTSTGFLQSEIDFCCKTLQSQIDDCCTALKTSTGFLQSQIDACCFSLQSEIDDCCTSLKTSTGFLQSQIDSCCFSLQSEIDDCCTALKTSTGFLQSQIDDCCTALKTSTGFLQSQIDSCCFSLQSEIDDCCTALKTSTGFLQSQIDDCCTSLKTSTGFLQSQIDSCCFSLQSEIDDCCTALKTSTGFLQSQIDDCCTALKTSTGFLQSQIDSCCFSLQSEIDDCCTALKTSTGFLQSQIDLCCSSLATSTGFLQSQIDLCCTMSTIRSLSCVITVTGDLYLTPAMLPETGTAVVFEFSPCFGSMCGCPPAIGQNNGRIPRVIVDPAVFGSNRIPLNPNTRLIFSGEGIVLPLDGIVWDYKGTPFSDMSDWPALIIEEKARMEFLPTTTVTFGGLAGKFIVRTDAELLINQAATNVIFGETENTQILHLMDQGIVQLGNVETNPCATIIPTPQLSYVYGNFDIQYLNASALNIINGTVELNTLDGVKTFSGNDVTGIITSLIFNNGSTLFISKTGNPVSEGLLRMAPNFGDSFVNFDNRSSTIYTSDAVNAGGNIQFRSFDASGKVLVDTTLVIQNNHFASGVSTILNAYMQLTYIIPLGVAATTDATILVRLGDIPNPSLDQQLAAYCPVRDGSVCVLKQGDHDVRYALDINGNSTIIQGLNSSGGTFTIFNCDPSTRIDN